MHVNGRKLVVGQNKVNYLSYDLEEGGFSLQSYIQSQKDKLPRVNSKGEIRKILGIFNVSRSVSPGLSCVVKPQQLALNASKFPAGSNLCKWVQNVWSYILINSIKLYLKSDTYHLQVDWSASGYGYLLYAGAPQAWCAGWGEFDGIRHKSL